MKQLKLYAVTLTTEKGSIMKMSWAQSPRIATKDVLKMLFQRSGVQYIRIGDKEFNHRARVLTYIMKNNLIDTVCKAYEKDILRSDNPTKSTI
jgi:hypothetical protein